MKRFFTLTLIALMAASCAPQGTGLTSAKGLANSNSCIGCGKGNEQGNASDLRPMDFEAAWFTGNKVIRYCYVIGEHFTVPNNEIQNDIAFAFAKWKDYIALKKVNALKKKERDEDNDKQMHDPNFPSTTPLSEHVLTTDSQLVPSQANDVSFGVTNPS